jgi:phospholipid/cholesterol/gamma-HCH transport system substrate-binding protein
VLTDVPPLIAHLAEKDYQQRLINAIDAVGRLSDVVQQSLGPSRNNLHQDLQSLQCPLKEVARATPDLLGAVKLIGTLPFDIDAVPKAFRGDFYNVSLTLDSTLSSVDNGFLTGTGLSGSLRALEQSFGRDPNTMIPDVRYTPNPNDAPGGPLIERGDRNC